MNPSSRNVDSHFRNRAAVFPFILAPPVVVAGFFQHWHITEISLFGLVLCDHYNRNNEFDVTIEFKPDSVPVLMYA